MFPKYSFSHRSLLKSNNQQNLSHIRFFALQLYLGFWFNCNLRTDRQRLYENLETSYNCTIVPNFYIPTKIIIRTFHHWGTFITKLGYHRDTEIILKLLSQRRQQLPSRTIGSLTSIRRESRDYAGSISRIDRPVGNLTSDVDESRKICFLHATRHSNSQDKNSALQISSILLRR